MKKKSKISLFLLFFPLFSMAANQKAPLPTLNKIPLRQERGSKPPSPSLIKKEDEKKIQGKVKKTPEPIIVKALRKDTQKQDWSNYLNLYKKINSKTLSLTDLKSHLEKILATQMIQSKLSTQSQFEKYLSLIHEFLQIFSQDIKDQPRSQRIAQMRKAQDLLLKLKPLVSRSEYKRWETDLEKAIRDSYKFQSLDETKDFQKFLDLLDKITKHSSEKSMKILDELPKNLKDILSTDTIKSQPVTYKKFQTQLENFETMFAFIQQAQTAPTAEERLKALDSAQQLLIQLKSRLNIHVYSQLEKSWQEAKKEIADEFSFQQSEKKKESAPALPPVQDSKNLPLTIDPNFKMVKKEKPLSTKKSENSKKFDHENWEEFVKLRNKIMARDETNLTNLKELLQAIIAMPSIKIDRETHEKFARYIEAVTIVNNVLHPNHQQGISYDDRLKELEKALNYLPSIQEILNRELFISIADYLDQEKNTLQEQDADFDEEKNYLPQQGDGDQNPKEIGT